MVGGAGTSFFADYLPAPRFLPQCPRSEATLRSAGDPDTSRGPQIAEELELLRTLPRYDNAKLFNRHVGDFGSSRVRCTQHYRLAAVGLRDKKGF